MTAPLTLDVDTLTFDELEIIEDRCGQSVVAVFNTDNMSAKAVRALTFIAARRADPAVTWEDIGRLTMGDIELGADTVPPTDVTA